MASNGTTGHKCPSPMMPTSNGVFQGDNPLDFALPLIVLQICLVVIVTRCLAFVLKPFKQPRVIAEIAGGILLGPSALCRNHNFRNAVFPKQSLTVLDALANLGVIFFLFLVGLELDPKSLCLTGKKALSIAIAGISLPFAMGVGTSFVLRATISKGVKEGPFLVFMGVALSITAFPVLARILAELKLLTTDVGRMAMSAAAINDVAAWILLAIAITLSGVGHSPLVSLWVFLSGIGFLLLCTLVIPPIFRWVARRCNEGEPLDEIYVCATLAAVLAAGFVTDSIGIHALFGAFVVGVLIPNEGPFVGALVEKVEDLVSGLFLPLFFVSSGMKTNIATIEGAQSWGLLLLVIFAACFGKIVGTVLVSLCCRERFQEALTLGFLMNTKGLVELIVLNIGKDKGVLNDQTFAIMVLMALFTTFITTPIVVTIYKPAQLARSEYKHRTIQRKEGSSELRLLTCFRTTRNIPSLINVIEASRGVENRVLRVYTMHLLELSERPSPIIMVHKARKNGINPFWSKAQNSDSNQLLVAFEPFGHLSQVFIQPATAISPLASMHVDICISATRNKVAMIILPFHKHQRPDGHLETTRVAFRHLNRRVLQQAPCSVGILVDRGLGGTSHVPARSIDYTIIAFFFGGHDDREALAYGARMAEHPGINLVAVQFKLDPQVVGEIVRIDVNDKSSPGSEGAEDEEFLSEFKENAIKVGSSITFQEKTVKDAAEIVEMIINMYSHCNLFLVGRMSEGQLVAALNTKAECPELGPVGNVLTAPEFCITASVLVVQQYRRKLSADSLESLNREDLTEESS